MKKLNNFLISIMLILICSCSSNKSSNATNDESDIQNNDSEVANSGELADIEKMCKQQDVPGALKVANKKYPDFKNSAQYWNLVGACFLKDIRPLKARLFFLRALEEDKNYAPALNNLGMVYWYLDKHYEALSYFKRSLQINPSSSITRYNLGRLYLWYGLHKNSASYLSLDSANSLSGKNLPGYVASNETLLEDYKSAVVHFRQNKINDSTMQGLYAIALKNSGMNDEAQSQWREAKLSANHPVQWLWIMGE